ncbi:MAG: flagellin [Lachnospiraceae bacterium]|nr:flagellin [Lachnospiraceae bacterium]MDE6624991.1 flagellin [Lachnospiraceae bacterium]
MSLSIERNYRNLSSGYRINRAADDAAGLSISEKLLTQKNGYDVGTQNAERGNSVLNVADGALSSIYDSLSRIRELGVQASNSAIYSKDELSMMQAEIDQIKKGIADVAKNTQFNGLKLLDGSMATMELATNPAGVGHEMEMVNASLEELGIADFDVTKSFNLKDIDNALKKVTSAQSSIGAQSNRLAYTIMNNQNTSYNLTSSYSAIRDTDMAAEMSDLHKNQILEQVRLQMQKKRMEQEQQKRKVIQVH